MPTNYKKLALYKTEQCRNWNETGYCRYGERCRYAHGPDELRNISRPSQYKTKACRSYYKEGACPYGVRCTFKHLSDEHQQSFISFSDEGMDITMYNQVWTSVHNTALSQVDQSETEEDADGQSFTSEHLIYYLKDVL
ncbi:hypothetical protein CU097_002013 [Rhizopus azygosporus]|uniref:C3H1-type domain-containing protein n=1 Tax=Rhizopus azygosporus TaxID=86630 RepID=A0A367IM51_RHIAZ|nr:hypothetical protein CU097_002013 [Rhizopus azygosporus]